MLILHHIPFIPSISGLLSTIAIGILAKFNTILVTEGIYVLPNPLSIPVIVISIHMNS